MRRLSSIKQELQSWQDLNSRVGDLEELVKISLEETADTVIEELTDEFESILSLADELEFKLQLNGEYDKRPAIIAVKAGAGGVDAQDWAEILFRMYCRWGERSGFEIEILEETPGDEAGLKSAVAKIDGDYAYGYLRSERGVHRLVRLSPFDSDHRRHTSFTLIEVIPEPDEAEEITINPDDLRVDVFRAGGHGGQSVQKNSTAVRLTHAPSGLVVSVQNERSQLQNKELAMRILHARLMAIEVQRRSEERAKLKGDHVSAEFGRQVRSYVLHPYQLVKDHRTNYQTGNAQAVLDGEIDGLLKSYLSSQVGEP